MFDRTVAGECLREFEYSAAVEFTRCFGAIGKVLDFLHFDY